MFNLRTVVPFVGTAVFLFGGPRVKGWTTRKEVNLAFSVQGKVFEKVVIF
jgi:hypothetical protein